MGFLYVRAWGSMAKSLTTKEKKINSNLFKMS